MNASREEDRRLWRGSEAEFDLHEKLCRATEHTFAGALDAVSGHPISNEIPFLHRHREVIRDPRRCTRDALRFFCKHVHEWDGLDYDIVEAAKAHRCFDLTFRSSPRLEKFMEFLRDPRHATEHVIALWNEISQLGWAGLSGHEPDFDLPPLLQRYVEPIKAAFR